MKKVPVFVVLIGCVFSWLIASMNPVTKIIDQSVYSYFNYQLMAIGIADYIIRRNYIIMVY